MKKIYLTIALILSVMFCLTAQNRQANLSQDQLASPSPSIYNTIGSRIHKDSDPIVSIMGCDTMKTTFIGGNSHNGNMFDLKNTSLVSPIQIMNLAQCFALAGTTDMAIYTKNGSYAGSEQIPGNWTLQGTASVSIATPSVPVVIPITLTTSIAPGATMAFYVTSTITSVSVAYSNGTNQTGVFRQKDSLQFKEGRGNPYPFGAPFGVTPSSRIWNGVISYCTPFLTGVVSLNTNDGTTTVYPNPMQNEATVTIANSIKLNNASLNIMDMAGRSVYTLHNINNNTVPLNHNLTSGLYLLQIENKGSVVLTKKISVE